MEATGLASCYYPTGATVVKPELMQVVASSGERDKNCATPGQKHRKNDRGDRLANH